MEIPRADKGTSLVSYISRLAGNAVSDTGLQNGFTSWTYDGLGREIQQSETVALGYKPGTSTSLGTTTATYNYQYDLDGNLTQSTDADGHVNTYAYNSTNQETGETWYASAAMAAAGVNDGTESFGYDVKGDMISAANIANGSTVASYSYWYDATGDVITERDQIGSVTPVALQSTYDYNGNRQTFSANIGGTVAATSGAVTYGTPDFTNTYGYDYQGHMTSVQQTSQPGNNCNGVTFKQVTLSYDDDNRVTGLKASDGKGASYSAAYGYDADSELTDLSYTTTQGNTILAAYHWDYDADGRVSDEFSRNDTSGGAGTNSLYSTWGETQYYSYDNDSQLTVTKYSNFANPPTTNTSPSYDANGDRTNNGSAGAGNRLLTDGTYYYTYDADGNRIARTQISNGAVTTYEWNNADELTAVLGGGGNALYAYDAFGRMVTQTESGATQNFIYDGQNIALVLNASGQVIERELYGPAVDQVLASETVTPVASGPQAAGPVNWFLSDNQGTVRDVAQYNGTTTSVVDHLVYDAFGQITSQSSSLPANQPRFTYNGMRYDCVSGFYDDGLREYSATDAVFASPDPIGFAAGQTNTEEYCGNSPTNAVDPSGLRTWILTDEQTQALVKAIQGDGIRANLVSDDYYSDPELAAANRSLFPLWNGNSTYTSGQWVRVKNWNSLVTDLDTIAGQHPVSILQYFCHSGLLNSMYVFDTNSDRISGRLHPGNAKNITGRIVGILRGGAGSSGSGSFPKLMIYNSCCAGCFTALDLHNNVKSTVQNCANGRRIAVLSPLGFPSGTLFDPHHAVDAVLNEGTETYTLDQWFNHNINLRDTTASEKKELEDYRNAVYASQNGKWALTLPDGVDGFAPVNSIAPWGPLPPQPPDNDGNIPPKNQ